MPVFWRYVLGQYFKVLFLALFAFIAVLLTSRLDEIAHFASLGPQLKFLGLFILYQIPLILPVAIPVSCLISAILLFQQLSATQELTALRASGMSLKTILAPLLVGAAALSALNFYIVSEVSTHSHFETNQLKSELRAINPLLLLHHKHLMRLKGIYFDTFGPSKMGEMATDAVVAMPNPKTERMNILIAKSLEADPENFGGKQVTLITSHGEFDREAVDPLVIENLGSADTPIGEFSPLLQKKVWTVNNDQLRLGLLWARLEDENAQLKAAEERGAPLSELKQIQRSINRVYSDFARRVSSSLAVLAFTLLGAAFGVTISRIKAHYKVGIVIGLGAIYLICFFAGKGIDHLLAASVALYFAPLALMMGASWWALRRTNQGVG